jgi:hypothetical protein
MERRNFLRMMVGGVAAAAAVRTFPFRVFSFPKEIELIEYPPMFGGKPISLLGLRKVITFETLSATEALPFDRSAAWRRLLRCEHFRSGCSAFRRS